MKELIIIIFITAIGVLPTVLGDLAASMNAGEWRELNTNGLSQEFLETYVNPSNRSILQYAAKAQWEPNSKKFFFLGSGHSNAYKFVVYSDATNSWTTGPLPSPYNSGDLNIRLTGNSGKGMIQILDMRGRLVQSFNAGKRITWKRAKTLTPGIYIVKWMHGSRKIALRKMIVVR